MPTVPLFGRGLKGKSVNASAQRRLNMYLEFPEEGDKSQFVLYPRPGLVPAITGFNPQITTSYTPPPGPCRGMTIISRYPYPILSFAFSPTLDWAQQYIVAVFHRCTALYPPVPRFSSAGADPNKWQILESPASQGDAAIFQTTAGPVVLATVDPVTLATDGEMGYIVGGGAGGSVDAAAAAAVFPNSATSVCALASRFIANDPSASGLAKFSGVVSVTTAAGCYDWPALNFFTAEANADPLPRVYSHHGELVLFGTRTIEFWAPTGDADIFARIGGTAINWGLAAFDTVQLASESLYFLGVTPGGAPQVVRMDGHTPQPVSTPDIEASIAAEMAMPGCAPNGVVVGSGGHTWYVLNLVSTSWAYDVTNGTWSEWQTDGARWAGQYAVTFDNKCYVSDYRNSNVYTFEDGCYTDNEAPITREVVTRHLFNDLDRLTVSALRVDCETGVGLTQGQGVDPQVMLQVSRDGGHTFGNEQWLSMGALGDYVRQLVWRRLGRSRDFVFKLRVSDPVKVVFLSASIEAS